VLDVVQADTPDLARTTVERGVGGLRGRYSLYLSPVVGLLQLIEAPALQKREQVGSLLFGETANPADGCYAIGEHDGRFFSVPLPDGYEPQPCLLSLVVLLAGVRRNHSDAVEALAEVPAVRIRKEYAVGEGRYSAS
jgi:hypothetical protein